MNWKFIRAFWFWISVIVIATWIEISLLSKGTIYLSKHCSFQELPKDLNP